MSSVQPHLPDHIYDVAIIGGGITGAAAARSLAQSGYSVVLLEAHDFASGTSSRTSRLQYCGLAYLFDFHQFSSVFRRPAEFIRRVRLVQRSMSERRRFLHDYPHRLKRIPFYIPVFEGDAVSPTKMALAMTVMRMLAPRAPFDCKMLRGPDLAAVPVRQSPDRPLVAAAQYYDYAYDWPERVCLDVLAEAKAAGAVTRNYIKVTGFRRQGEDWSIRSVDHRQQAEIGMPARAGGGLRAPLSPPHSHKKRPRRPAANGVLSPIRSAPRCLSSPPSWTRQRAMCWLI